MQWFAAVALFGHAVTAPAADIDCAAFGRSIDASQRQLSKLRAQYRGLPIASRADVQARIQQELTLLQINVSILLKSNCATPSKPVTLDGYSKAADECENAVRRSDSAAPIAACDVSKWLPD